MSGSGNEGAALTPQESWGAIHTTINKTRSSMYLAGTSPILLMWGALTAVLYLIEYWFQTGGSALAEETPWIRAPVFGVLVIAGMVGSGFIGRRYGSRNVTPEAGRAVGIRVFFYWVSVALAAWFIPAAAGMWSPEGGPQIPHVAIGIVTLGYVLYGIMTHAALAAVGVGIAAAYYLPDFLAGDAALPVSAAATFAVVGLGALWLHRIGIR